jgi:hypothetical protein
MTYLARIEEVGHGPVVIGFRKALVEAAAGIQECIGAQRKSTGGLHQGTFSEHSVNIR